MPAFIKVLIYAVFMDQIRNAAKSYKEEEAITHCTTNLCVPFSASITRYN